MNLVSGNMVAAQRDILGLPVCELGWADALAFAEKAATLPFGQTVIAFIDAGNARLMARDPEYRAVLERQVVLPDGHGIDIASVLLHGQRFPADLNGADFVPALLTHIAKPMRVALIGARPETLALATETFRRHAPWHTFLPVSDGFFDRVQSDAVMERVRAAEADILLVAMGSPAQEKWIDRHVGPGHARLVLSVGALFDIAADRMRPAPAGAERLGRLLRRTKRLWQRHGLVSPLFLYRVLRYRLTDMEARRYADETAKAGAP